MRDQLTYLAQVAQLPNVSVRIKPLDESFPVVTNSFDLLTFGPTDDATMPDVVWAEHVFSAIYFEGEADTFQYHLVFRAMRNASRVMRNASRVRFGPPEPSPIYS